mmetsp:Transcript_50433/g.131246  ORF Transcript_50433/g.131246 Transcript_50433/m.131246 type:complete len:419 (-) Transcript_50433:118-1374(-)
MVRIAVVGGGIGACHFIYGIREHLVAQQASLTLFEMGRAAGGRAATRITRDQPGLRVNHGVPAFSAHSTQFRKLAEDMVTNNVLARCIDGPFQFAMLDASTGSFELEDATTAPARYTSAPGSGMGALCESLLRGGDPVAPLLVQASYSTMVSKVTRHEDSWQLFSKSGESLGSYDWLVVSSTAFAHPRWTATFGGEPPLVEAAKLVHDEALDCALSALAPLRAKPVTACLLAYTGEAASKWARLPFFKLRIEGDDVLCRIVVQRINPNLTAVVLHSTHPFSEGGDRVYGATSAAARIAGAKSDAQAEGRILSQMLEAAETRLNETFGSGTVPIGDTAWGPLLHRWGAAFPDSPLLDAKHAFLPSVKVAFCGDFVRDPRSDGIVGADEVGTLERAALSGLQAARLLSDTLAETCPSPKL